MSLEDKKRSLTQRSLEGIRQSPTADNRLDENGLPWGFPLEEIFGLMEYFDGQPVYSVDMPILRIPHPEPRRRLVDPDLRDTPIEQVINIGESRLVTSFHDLTETFNRLIEEGKEIFIYIFSLTATMYDPFNFAPERRVLVRYTTIDKSVWTTPIEGYVEPMRTPIEENHHQSFANPYGRDGWGAVMRPNPRTTEESFESPLEEEDIVIKKSRNNLNFG
jgi:hypothetical protein